MKPDTPTRTTSRRLISKPRATIQTLSRILERICALARNGWTKANPKISPIARAEEGEAQGLIVQVIAIKKMMDSRYDLALNVSQFIDSAYVN
jgi:hypothetical protein